MLGTARARPPASLPRAVPVSLSPGLQGCQDRLDARLLTAGVTCLDIVLTNGAVSDSRGKMVRRGRGVGSDPASLPSSLYGLRTPWQLAARSDARHQSVDHMSIRSRSDQVVSQLSWPFTTVPLIAQLRRWRLRLGTTVCIRAELARATHRSASRMARQGPRAKRAARNGKHSAAGIDKSDAILHDDGRANK